MRNNVNRWAYDEETDMGRPSRVCGRMMGVVDNLLTAETTDPANQLQLAQLKLSLVEKLETLKQFDAEVLELTEEQNLEDEIQRADNFKSDLYSPMVKLDSVSSMMSVPPTTIAPSTVTTTVTPADPDQTSQAQHRVL